MRPVAPSRTIVTPCDGVTSHITQWADEPDTGKAVDELTDWRRMLSIFDGLGLAERESLIRLASSWASLDNECRVLVTELARRLPLAQRVQ